MQQVSILLLTVYTITKRPLSFAVAHQLYRPQKSATMTKRSEYMDRTATLNTGKHTVQQDKGKHRKFISWAGVFTKVSREKAFIRKMWLTSNQTMRLAISISETTIGVLSRRQLIMLIP